MAKVKFFADDMNDRRTWSWENGEYVTDDSAEIENMKGIGFRFEDAGDNPEEKKASIDGPNPGTVAWIKQELDKLGTTYDGITKKAELQELLDMANEPAK